MFPGFNKHNACLHRAGIVFETKNNAAGYFFMKDMPKYQYSADMLCHARTLRMFVPSSGCGVFFGISGGRRHTRAFDFGISGRNAMKEKEIFEVEGKKLALTHLDKVYFPDFGGTKAELIDYYIRMSPYILPYLKGRPFSMLHYPDGIDGKTYYQKQRPDDAPEWLASVILPSGEKTVDWCLVNDLPSLIYMANRSCIETHAWFSRLPDLDRPDVAIFDLDPSGDTGFAEAVKAALLVKTALDSYGLWSIPKISGKTGVHVVVPIEQTPYEKVRRFLKVICRHIEGAQPGLFTTQRVIARRGNKVYLDAVQNGRGKTLPSPYSVRATPNANVSAPVTWMELRKGANPEQFTIRNMDKRLEKAGDLFAPVYTTRQPLPDMG